MVLDPTAPLNVVTPDLSGMNQPGSAAAGPMPTPNQPAPPPEVMTPGMTAPDVTDRSINPAVAPPAPAGANTGAPPPKHAALLKMVQGLADGLNAAGVSFATKGQRGGAEMVQELQGQRQQAAQSAQAAAQAQKNAQLQNQLTQQEINRQNTMNYVLGSTWKDQVDKSHFEAQSAQQNVTKGALDVDTAVAGYQRENFGLMPPSQVTGGATAPVTPDERARVQTSLGSAINLGTGVLGTNQDPTLLAAIDKAKTVVANPNASRADILGAGQGLTNALQANKAVTAARKEQGEAAATAPLGTRADSLNAAMLDRYKVLNPGGTALPKGYALDANSTPKDFDRVDKIMQQTETAQGTKAQRDIINQMREQTLKLTQGTTGTGDTTKTGKDYLATLNPSRAGNVQAFGEGRAQVNSRSFSTPAGQALLSDITAAYPDYDQSKAITWDKTRNEYTGSGATAKKAVSYNTALEHMQDLYNNSTKEGLYLPGSKAYSDRSVALGYVANEVGSAIKTGVMSKEEGQQILDSLKGWTPSTAKERVAETARLLHDKIEEYQTKFADAAPSSAVKVPTLLSPKAQAAYNFVEGINQTPAAAAPAAPAGATGKAYPKGQTSGPQYWHDANGKNLGLVQ